MLTFIQWQWRVKWRLYILSFMNMAPYHQWWKDIYILHIYMYIVTDLYIIIVISLPWLIITAFSIFHLHSTLNDCCCYSLMYTVQDKYRHIIRNPLLTCRLLYTTSTVNLGNTKSPDFIFRLQYFIQSQDWEEAHNQLCPG